MSCNTNTLCLHSNRLQVVSVSETLRLLTFFSLKGFSYYTVLHLLLLLCIRVPAHSPPFTEVWPPLPVGGQLRGAQELQVLLFLHHLPEPVHSEWICLGSPLYMGPQGRPPEGCRRVSPQLDTFVTTFTSVLHGDKLRRRILCTHFVVL